MTLVLGELRLSPRTLFARALPRLRDRRSLSPEVLGLPQRGPQTPYIEQQEERCRRCEHGRVVGGLPAAGFGGEPQPPEGLDPNPQKDPAPNPQLSPTTAVDGVPQHGGALYGNVCRVDASSSDKSLIN